ncbi:MAG TPA: hypothetical protein VGA56_14925 [Opitutaceae bacterium]
MKNCTSIKMFSWPLAACFASFLLLPACTHSNEHPTGGEHPTSGDARSEHPKAEQTKGGEHPQ